MNKDWKIFELITKEIQQQLSPDALLTHDEKIKGKSEIYHQCDVTLRSKIFGQFDFLCVFECKDLDKKVGLEVVKGFVEKIKDIRANQGILVSRKGFTKHARTYSKEKGIVLYTLIDTRKEKWSDFAFIPIAVGKTFVKELSASMIDPDTKNGVNLIDKHGMEAPEDKIYVFDMKNNRYIKIKDLIEEKWDEIFEIREPSPSEVFETKNREYFLYGGDKKHVPVIIKYSFKPETCFYYGNLSLTKCQGFKNTQTDELLADNFETSVLDFKTVITKWNSVITHEELPINPICTFWMGHFKKKKFDPQPTKIIILASRTKPSKIK